MKKKILFQVEVDEELFLEADRVRFHSWEEIIRVLLASIAHEYGKKGVGGEQEAG